MCNGLDVGMKEEDTATKDDACGFLFSFLKKIIFRYME